MPWSACSIASGVDVARCSADEIASGGSHRAHPLLQRRRRPKLGVAQREPRRQLAHRDSRALRTARCPIRRRRSAATSTTSITNPSFETASLGRAGPLLGAVGSPVEQHPKVDVGACLSALRGEVSTPTNGEQHGHADHAPQPLRGVQRLVSSTGCYMDCNDGVQWDWFKRLKAEGCNTTNVGTDGPATKCTRRRQQSLERHSCKAGPHPHVFNVITPGDNYTLTLT